MPSSLSFTLIDHSAESTTVTIPVANVTAANFDTVLGNIATQGRFELEAAIEAVTTGALSNVGAKAFDEPQAGATPPADVWSQREIALRVYGRGATSGKLYTISIGTADLDALNPGIDDDVPLAGTAMADLVTALEDNWRPTYDGAVGTTEAIVVERAQIVGRRN